MLNTLFNLLVLSNFLSRNRYSGFLQHGSRCTSGLRLPAGQRLQVNPHDSQFRQKRIFVSNLPPHVDWRQLKNYFTYEFGDKVVYASVSEDLRTGLSKGCGLVQFQTIEDAQRAIECMHGSVFDGYSIHVREDRQTREGSNFERKFRNSDEYLYEDAQRQVQRKQEYVNKNPTHRRIVPKEEFLSQPYVINESASQIALSKIQDIEARNEMIKFIEMNISMREKARREKNFDEADKIRSMLREKFKVSCDDSNRTWRILNTEK